MGRPGASTCPQCQVLAAELASSKAEVAKLREELAAARKNSTTSSKPPSSDIVKPPSLVGDEESEEPKRKIGGQPGHPKHDRQPFSPEEITSFHTSLLNNPVEIGLYENRI